MTHHELIEPIAKLKAPWDQNDNHAWLGSSLTLQRNLDNFKFPSKMTPDRRQQVISLASQQLLSNPELLDPTLLKAEDLSPLDKEYLVEHFFSTQNFQQAHIGEAFLIDQSGNFLVTFNLNNHLQLTLVDSHEDIEKSWNRLLKIETSLGTALRYAFSPKFGFLTADPHQAGTAFLATIYLQLPALAQSGELDSLLNKFRDEQIVITGMHGSPTEIIGDIIAIQNNFTLAVTEEGILTTLRNITTKLQVQENAARLKLREQEKPVIKDHVSRAYGLLVHSYQLEAIEALNALSLLKLGVDLDWVKGITIAEINQLFFSCRRAHLIGKVSGPASNEELPHKRAEYLHRSLANVTLTI